MRVAAYGTAIMALSTSILAFLIYSRYWNGVPNLWQMIESLGFVFPICIILVMAFSGWVNRHPEPALGASFMCFGIGVLAIGL